MGSILPLPFCQLGASSARTPTREASPHLADRIRVDAESAHGDGERAQGHPEGAVHLGAPPVAWMAGLAVTV